MIQEDNNTQDIIEEGNRLNRAIQLLAVAIIAFALDIIIANVFPV